MPAATLTRQERKRRKVARTREREIESRNYSPEQKRAIRAEHSARVRSALAMLEDEDGMSRFLESRALNPHLTPLAAALAAHDAPGRLLGSMPYWKAQGARVRKGERAIAYGTRPGFWPLPLFAAEQTDYPDEYADAQLDEIGEPSPGLVAAAVAGIRAAYAATGRKTATLNAWTEAEAI